MPGRRIKRAAQRASRAVRSVTGKRKAVAARGKAAVRRAAGRALATREKVRSRRREAVRRGLRAAGAAATVARGAGRRGVSVARTATATLVEQAAERLERTAARAAQLRGKLKEKRETAVGEIRQRVELALERLGDGEE